MRSWFLAGRGVVQGQRRFLGALPFRFGHPVPQFFRVAYNRTGVGMRCRPLAGIFAKAMEVEARLASQFVLDAPDLFKNRVRLHTGNLP
jgi:hypothetical protein